jgi:beta-mannosidase
VELFPLVLDGLGPDLDPLPRAAPVGPGSAYAAVSGAAPVPDLSVSPVTVAVEAARRAAPLATWQFRPDHDEAWRTVAVPHVWSRSEPDLADYKGPCWYSRLVDVGPPGSHHQLRFDGLDYVASVHADGRLLGHHEGGFTPVAFDLPAGSSGEVLVSVRVDDPVEEALLGPWPVADAKRKVKGVFEFHDSRPGGHSHGSWFSPLWARRWGTGGMVEPAWLVSTGPVRLDAAFVTARPGRIQVSWVVSNLGAHEVDVALDADVGGAGVRVAAVLGPGAHRLSISGALSGAVAWSPTTGRGHRSAVYRLHTVVRADGAVSDAGSTTFGVRSVEMPLEPDDQFRLRVNGERLYVRAVNYIPGVWLPELSAEVFRRDIELAAAANCNSLGPHAHVLPDRFYDAADEAGMLVYQDFPLNLANDPAGPPLFEGGPTMGEASLLLAAEASYHLYNRPSVVYWCAHNEPAYQLGEGFGSGHPDIDALRRRLLSRPSEEALDDARVALWNDIDPTRPAYKASGLGRTRPVGDQHTYTGSLSTDPMTAVARTSAAFMSEFGGWTTNFSAPASGVPGARGDWPPGDEVVPDWEHRTHMWFSHALRAGRPERHADFNSWTFAAQLWAGSFIKTAIESYRARAWDPFGGHRYHLFVDHYGDAGAGVVDRHRLRQAHYWALADANRPVLPVVDVLPSMRVAPDAPVALRAHVVNDSGAVLDDVELSWSVVRLEADGAFLIGVDDPQVPHRFGTPVPPWGDVVVVPRTDVGLVLASGTGTDVAFSACAADDGPVPCLIRLVLRWRDGEVRNWGAFVVAPPDWVPVPGITPAPRFRLRLMGGHGERVVDRWTGAPADGPVLPPGQYTVVGPSGRALHVDLYGDVDVDVCSRRAVARSSLPWRFQPA